MAQLLVSVRSVEEAACALAGGAAIIDVKEPRLGPLGRADDTVLTEILYFVAGRRPVSAAFGELLDGGPPFSNAAFLSANLSFAKWGLAGCGPIRHWSTLLANQHTRLFGLSDNPVTGPTCVFVAYADWQCAQAPPLNAVVNQACRTSPSILLIDTCCKTSAAMTPPRRPTLLDWISVEEITELVRRCGDAQVRVALAGSLGVTEISLLRSAQPTWFAVRGAVCEEGSRDGTIEECRVREFARLLEE